MSLRPFCAWLRALLVGSTLFAAAPRVASAQCSSNQSSGNTIVLCMNVRDVLLMTLSTSTSSLGTPKLVNYGAQSSYLSTATPLAATGPDVTIVANRAYEVTIAAAQATFATAPAGVSKPTSDVQWIKSGGAATSLSTTGASLATGTAGTAPSFQLSFQSRWAFERDKPGSYSTTITLTLAAK